MSYQIIKQPNDQFAIFSTFTDTIIIWDATGEEIVDWFADLAAKRAREDAQRILGHVAVGEAREAYFQFAMTWDDGVPARPGPPPRRCPRRVGHRRDRRQPVPHLRRAATG